MSINPAQTAPVRSEPLTFVLVHGSWADAGFWNGAAAALRQMGHTVYAPEFPGHGGDPNKNVSHAQMSKAVGDYIAAKQLKDIVLVGHSFGGTIVQKTAELVPDRLKRLVFWNAFVLNDGQSMADVLPKQAVDFFLQLAAASSDNTIALPFPYFRDAFVNTADLPTAHYIHRHSPPEPAAPFREQLDLKRFYALQVPKSYLYLTEDNVLPQFDDTGWHPHFSSRLGQFRLIKGHGDHMTPAYVQPDKLARLLVQAGRD